MFNVKCLIIQRFNNDNNAKFYLGKFKINSSDNLLLILFWNRLTVLRVYYYKTIIRPYYRSRDGNTIIILVLHDSLGKSMILELIFLLFFFSKNYICFAWLMKK